MERLQPTHDELDPEVAEQLGPLAAGIVHDINNMLLVILSYAMVLKEDLPNAGDDLEEIIQAGTKAASLTNRLLSLKREPKKDLPDAGR
ncbi:MAG: histidine kinase dimerization/phospho-acceptor domain-containing protein [Polyangiaceae bacterium]|jgi:signal transduction histidine kinase